jgi:hypothetical protein
MQPRGLLYVVAIAVAAADGSQLSTQQTAQHKAQEHNVTIIIDQANPSDSVVCRQQAYSQALPSCYFLLTCVCCQLLCAVFVFGVWLLVVGYFWLWLLLAVL